MTSSVSDEEWHIVHSTENLRLSIDSLSPSNDADSQRIKSAAVAATKRVANKHHKKNGDGEDDEPLVDTTEILPLHSKRLERQQKRQEAKRKKTRAKEALSSILRLPAELLLQVFSFLEPLDVIRAELICRDLRDFVKEQETVIAKEIIRRRYWVLAQAFPRPVLLADVPAEAHPALLNTKRQTMLAIHKRPYQHVPVIDMMEFCTCMSCVFAWNNLNVILDSAHWQDNLDRRNPIPMISRGTMPSWNKDLLQRHADIVRKSVASPLTYAMILQRHLNAINKTLLRRARWHKKPGGLTARLYDATDEDLASGTDEYLDRYGPHSYEFPFHRDNYYSMEAYVPNRKWSKDHKRWMYYSGNQHERDVAWTMAHFSLSP